MAKKIFGISVSDEVHKKYKDKRWDLGGVKVGLYALEDIASDKHDPDREEARRLLELIRKDVESDMASSHRDNEKKKLLSASSFADYCRALGEMARDLAARYDEEEATADEWIAKYRKQAGDRQKSDIERLDAEARAMVAESDKKRALAAIRQEYHTRVSEIRANYVAFVEDALLATPDKMDADSISLLKSGIMRPKEIRKMFDSFSDNPCMLRIVAKYAQDMIETNGKRLATHERHDLEWICHTVNGIGTGEKWLKQFDGLAQLGSRMVGEKYEFGKVYRAGYAEQMDAALKMALSSLGEGDGETDGETDGGTDGGNGSAGRADGSKTKSEIMNIKDAKARQSAIAENMNLFS